MIQELENLSRQQLIELIGVMSKNMLALDGVWFQSVEQEAGMEEAIRHDRQAWRRFTEIEARRIKQMLALPPEAGIEGLRAALTLRFNHLVHVARIEIEGNTLTYRIVDCRVQTARARKGMPFHPCKPVGLVEYTYFARVIDPRFACEAVSCFPDIREPACACVWKFTLMDHPVRDE